MSILTAIRSTVGLIYDQVLSFWLNVKTCVEARRQIPVGLFVGLLTKVEQRRNIEVCKIYFIL